MFIPNMVCWSGIAQSPCPTWVISPVSARTASRSMPSTFGSPTNPTRTAPGSAGAAEKKKSGAGVDFLTLWCSTSQKQRDSTQCCSQGQDDSFGYDSFAKLPLHSMDGCCSRGLAKMGVHAPFTTLCFPFQPPDCHNRKWSCQNGRPKKMDGRSNLGIHWNIVKCLFRP